MTKPIDLKKCIRDIPDFPKQGIIFKDLSTLLRNRVAFKKAVDQMVSKFKGKKIDFVVGVEARGFIFGAAVAYKLGAGFVPIRKEGKLPHQTFRMSYQLEYGEAVLEIHADAMKKGKKAVIIDDVLATGGTVQAAIRLVEKFGVGIIGAHFLIELSGLEGRKKLANCPVQALVTY